MTESNIIQMHDYAGNNQYPVTLASLVYDEDGETVSKKLALLLDWFEWGDEEQTSVKTKYHFWSEKQLSAGGIGEEGEGGGGGIGTITGIKVNGEVWNEPDEFGVLTIPDYPTSLEWANINGKPTHLSQFTDDVVAGHYLPLTGGTITGNLTINGYLYANSRIVEKTIMEFHHIDGDFVYLANDKYSGKGDGKGLAMYNKTYWHSLLHSGNVGDYAVIKSTAIDLSQTNLNVAGYGTSASGWLLNGPAIAIGHPNGYTMLLQQRTDNNRICVNRKNPNGIAGDWKTIAFTDSDITGNAASATKIQTPRTIWGQSFDGTGDINGPLYFGQGKAVLYATKPDGPANMIFAQVNPDGIFLLGQQTAQSGYDTCIYGNNINFCYGTAGLLSYTAMSINSSGNVTIGNGDLAGTNAKLAVWGNQRIYRGGVTAEYLDISVADVSVYYNAYDPDGYRHQHFQSNGNTRLFINGFSGYVGIGTSAPDEMLHVAGNIRLKNTTNFGCSLKFGDYEHCYLYEDTDDHLKIYARAGILLSTDVGYGVTIDKSLTIGSAVLSWDYTNNALKIEGNVYTTGQLSAGGVGTEVQKVFDIAAVSDATTANQSYTSSLTHNLNTYDLAVVVYEVEETYQTDGTKTEKLTQVLADVTLTDENNVMAYFASRKINKKYRIVIIG